MDEKGPAQYEQARTLGEMGLAISREAGSPMSTVLFLVQLSSVALGEAERSLSAGTARHLEDAGKAREAYGEAHRLARECAAIAREIGCHHDSAWAHAALAVAARGLGSSHRARQHVFEALRIGSEIEAVGQIELALRGVALLLTDAGKNERAVELYSLVSREAGRTQWEDDVFGRHIDAVAATMPLEVAEAARERGRARDLEETVKELLAELSTWDSQHPEPSQP